MFRVGRLSDEDDFCYALNICFFFEPTVEHMKGLKQGAKLLSTAYRFTGTLDRFLWFVLFLVEFT